MTIENVFDKVKYAIYWNNDNRDAAHIRLHRRSCSYLGQHNASNADTDRNGYILFTREEEARKVMQFLACNKGIDNVRDCRCISNS